MLAPKILAFAALAAASPQQGDYYYNTGVSRGGNQYVSVQQGNQFASSQYYTGENLPTSYQHAPGVFQPSFAPARAPQQYDPFQPFHTNQHLPQPFHTAAPPPFQPYYEPRPTGALVDQLDTSSRWRRPSSPAPETFPQPTTLRPRVTTSPTESPIRSRPRSRSRTETRDSRVRPTTYTPSSTPILPRSRSRYTRPDLPPRVRSTTVPTTTTTEAIEYDLYDYELAPQNEADGPISIDQLEALGPPEEDLRPLRPANATFYDVFKPLRDYERDPEPAVDPYKLVPEPTITTYRAKTFPMTAPTPTTAREEKEEPRATEQMKKPEEAGLPTESWVIVASVQTSRSVSGARFLPSEVIEQEEQPKARTPTGGIERTPRTEDEEPATPDPVVSRIPPSGAPPVSTESIIDKLDRVQSELSSGILGFSHGDNKLELEPLPDMTSEKIEASSSTATTYPAPVTSSVTTPASTMISITTASPTSSTTPIPVSTSTTEESDVSSDQTFVRKFVPAARRTTTTTTAKPTVKKSILDAIEFDELTGLLPPNFKVRTFKPKTAKTTTTTTTESSSGESKTREGSGRSSGTSYSNRIKQDDVSAFLPPGYKKSSTTTQRTKPKSVEDILGKITFDDISSLLPPGFNKSTEKEEKKNVDKSKPVVKTVGDLPPGLLPPGYKPPKESELPANLLPAGYKPPKELDLPPGLLPPGYKAPKKDSSNSTSPVDSILSKVKFKEVGALVPPGYKPSSEEESTTPTPKIVFPTRPSAPKKLPPRTSGSNTKSAGGLSPLQPKINKGWPVRSTTEFTGWPTPSTTPISVEKILAAAKAAAATTTTTTEATTTTTVMTTTTTTTRRPTTPGVCSSECDMAATLRLTGPQAKWLPELLDHNTLEYQQMATDVTKQLDTIYSSSDSLSRWYKKITIDAFSEGSIIVDYLVELSELGKTVSTADMKRLFHESLARYTIAQESLAENAPARHRSANATPEFTLGRFTVDPAYTDFIVLPKRPVPTVGFAEEEELLPQWAIAVIVIGLASLLFVIIFGVTVLVNRHKGAKKKQPSGLTEDMLHQLNKGHLTGLDNYGADPADLYNMEDVWNDKPVKKRSSGSMQENSMANLYDSWRSEWNGYYYNNGYYGNGGYPGGYPGSNGGFPGGNGYGGASTASGFSRRRSDYDTNF